MYIDRKTKKRIPKKNFYFFAAITVVLVVLITGIVMFVTMGRDIKDSLVEMPFSNTDSYYSVAGNLVYEAGDLLTCTDASLKDVWKAQLFASGLNITANDNLITAYNENIIMVLNDKGINLFSKQLDGTIKSVRQGKDKVAVYTDQILTDKSFSYIVIFDLSGNSIFQIDVSGKYVLDYGFDIGSNQLFILDLDVSGASPISRITTYRPESQSITGIKEIKDQLIEKVYIDADEMYTMGTTHLSVYTSINTADRTVLVYGWMLEDINTNDSPKFVYVPSTSDSYIEITRIINASGEVKINLPPSVFKILYCGEKIYCFASDKFFVYTSQGKYLRKYDFPFEIDDVRRAMEGYAFLTAGGKVYLLPLP